MIWWILIIATYLINWLIINLDTRYYHKKRCQLVDKSDYQGAFWIMLLSPITIWAVILMFCSEFLPEMLGKVAHKLGKWILLGFKGYGEN